MNPIGTIIIAASCVLFISGEIDSRIIILTLHFKSMLLVSHGSQTEDQGCWAQV